MHFSIQLIMLGALNGVSNLSFFHRHEGNTTRGREQVVHLQPRSKCKTTTWNRWPRFSPNSDLPRAFVFNIERQGGSMRPRPVPPVMLPFAPGKGPAKQIEAGRTAGYCVVCEVSSYFHTPCIAELYPPHKVQKSYVSMHIFFLLASLNFLFPSV